MCYKVYLWFVSDFCCVVVVLFCFVFFWFGLVRFVLLYLFCFVEVTFQLGWTTRVLPGAGMKKYCL